jgi:hypothetical protein
MVFSLFIMMRVPCDEAAKQGKSSAALEIVFGKASNVLEIKFFGFFEFWKLFWVELAKMPQRIVFVIIFGKSWSQHIKREEVGEAGMCR